MFCLLFAEFRKIFKWNNKWLLKHLECRYGFLDKLVRYGVIKREEVNALRKEETKSKMNSRLLEVMLTKKDVDEYNMFIEALNETRQQHVIGNLFNLTGWCYTFNNVC